MVLGTFHKVGNYVYGYKRTDTGLVRTWLRPHSMSLTTLTLQQVKKQAYQKEQVRK